VTDSSPRASEPVQLTGRLQAVLLDMDGTVCDTEPAWMATERRMAAANGAEWTKEDGLALVGNSLLESGAYIKRRMRLSKSTAEIVDDLHDGVIEEIGRRGVEWLPGAVDLVEACNARGIPVALVTMSYRRFAAAVLETMPRGAFDVVVTGEDVERGKPAPDAYLAAASALGVEPTSCVAVEDSPTGAASAYAAGCTVMVVPNHVPVPLVGDMRELDSLAGVGPEDLARVLAER
jgi:HAD superfamily hydrolase (TIGR01509 family)